MVEYLSAEWIAEADRLLRAATPDPKMATVIVEQQIQRRDDDRSLVAVYHLGFGPEGCWAADGPADDPTVSYAQTLEAAVAIATEQRTAHEAFMLGELRVSGDSARLVDLLPANQMLGEILGPLRDRTVYPTDL